jgi:HNH endonuclease
LSKLAITVASDRRALENLERSVRSGLELTKFAGLATRPNMDALLPTLRRHAVDGRVRLWGSVPGERDRHRRSWERLEAGDWIAFSVQGRFRVAGRVYALLDDPVVADAVWDPHPTAGSYRYMTFFDALTDVSVSRTAMSDALGYGSSYIYRGFLVPADEAQAHLAERFGDVASFLGALQNELDAVQVISGQAPSPASYVDALSALGTNDAVERAQESLEEHLKTEPPDAVRALVRRFRRDETLVRKLKALYEGRCQRCGFTFTMTDGRPYSEAAHIRAIAEQLPGIDSPDNIVVLCANCHRQLDHGGLVIFWDESRQQLMERIDGSERPITNHHVRSAWREADRWQRATIADLEWGETA